jgi:L-asparagine transporter-like permease
LPLALLTANRILVKLFGEFEFWFSFIKVVTIILVIALGLSMILLPFGDVGIADTRVALFIAPVWAGMLLVGYAAGRAPTGAASPTSSHMREHALD